VTLQGAGGFSRVITASEQLELLSPGTYILSPANVSSGGKTYRASQGNQPLILAPGTMATTTVVYGAGDGSLALTISGLPAGTAPAVTITGPDGIARIAANAPSPLQFLEPGSYTIDAGIVGSSLTTHRPVPVTQTVTIADGTTSLATVTYGSEPLQLSVQLVAEGLTQPVFLTAPDGDARLFIVERVGVVKIFANGGVLPTPFLDIRDRVNNAGERGLLSMAFDPQYATNGFFYVYYVDFAGNVVVERFASAAGSDVAGGSASIVISIPHGGSEHHGGLVAFGPDGMMYLAPGDGGCCGDPLDRAQNGSTLLGKLLRIDVRTLPYQIPVDNPFTNGDGARAEIWASGLRSPWRFSFDLPTGTLHQADVGENDREEVNAVPSNAPGLNYGWRRMEGTACFIPATGCDPAGFLTHPVLEYTHAEGCSVIGGYVYRGVAIPELTGHYLYADFCRGWLRSFRSLAGAAPDQRSWNNVTLRFTNSFGRDGMGELYMIGGTRVWRIVRP
jgi:glucose/arabinose dehydrogenase